MVNFILTEYVTAAMAEAIYDKLDDGSYSGKISSCIGIVAFGVTLAKCEEELRSTLEDWILLGLKLGHQLPTISGINLNKEPEYEPVAAL